MIKIEEKTLDPLSLIGPHPVQEPFPLVGNHGDNFIFALGPNLRPGWLYYGENGAGFKGRTKWE